MESHHTGPSHHISHTFVISQHHISTMKLNYLACLSLLAVTGARPTVSIATELEADASPTRRRMPSCTLMLPL